MRLVRLLTAIVLLSLVPSSLRAASATDRYAVTIPSAISAEMRVIKFSCVVTNGAIVSIREIAQHWSVSIQNARIGTWVRAQNLSGEGILERDYFNSFIVVQDDSPPDHSKDFDVSCEVGSYYGLDPASSQFRVKWYDKTGLALTPVAGATPLPSQ